MWGSYFLDKDGVKDEKLWFGCSLKNPAFMWWVQKKPIQYRGGFPQKGGGLGQFADLRGGGCWWERGGCFWVGGYTAVSTGNDPLWQQNITQDRKLFVT